MKTAGRELPSLPFFLALANIFNGNNLCKRDFISCLEAAGIRHMTFHALRHTFASLLIQQGASLAYVKEQIGHSSLKVTVDT